MVLNIVAWIGDDRDGKKKIAINMPSLAVSEKVLLSQEIVSKLGIHDLFYVQNRW